MRSRTRSDELEFGSNIQDVTSVVDYFDRLNQTMAK